MAAFSPSEAFSDTHYLPLAPSVDDHSGANVFLCVWCARWFMHPVEGMILPAQKAVAESLAESASASDII